MTNMLQWTHALYRYHDYHPKTSYGLYSHGLYSHGLYSYGLYSYGLYSYALYSYALYSYGLYSYALYSYGLYSYGLYSYGLYSYSGIMTCYLHPKTEGAGAPHAGTIWDWPKLLSPALWWGKGAVWNLLSLY